MPSVNFKRTKIISSSSTCLSTTQPNLQIPPVYFPFDPQNTRVVRDILMSKELVRPKI